MFFVCSHEFFNTDLKILWYLVITEVASLEVIFFYICNCLSIVHFGICDLIWSFLCSKLRNQRNKQWKRNRYLWLPEKN
jgi:heme O synthase-like polyprenyltransferase